MSVPARPTPARLVPPRVLMELGNLSLAARTVVEGALTGLHRSPRFGFSQEFAEYRDYVPGDDLRFVDWNVLARTDRTCVKRYFGDTNTRVVVLLDASGSMGIAPAPGAVAKLDLARCLAAVVVFLAARQHDAVGLATFASGLGSWQAPSTRPEAAFALYHRLEALEAEGETDWPSVLDRVGAQLGKRSLLVLISDFLCEPEPLAARVRALGAFGHDLLLLQVLDPSELQLVLNGAALLRDVETGAAVPVAAEAAQVDYRQRLGAHLLALEHLTGAAGGHYRLMRADQPLDRAVADYLRFRERHP